MRIEKSLSDRVWDLKAHVRIIEDALQHIENGDDGFYKTIAASLRVLVWRGKNNTPLLIDIAEEMELAMGVTTRGIRNIDGQWEEVAESRILEDFLQMTSFGSQGRSVSNIDLIRMVAEQDGLAHEDRGLDSVWKTGEVMFKGEVYFIRELKRIADSVLDLSRKVITVYENRKKS